MAKKEDQQRDIIEIAEQATSWIEKNSKLFVVSFIAITLVLVSFWAVSSINQKNMEKTAKAAGLVNRKIELLQKSIAESKPAETAAAEKKEQFETRKKEAMDAITKDVKSLISEFPSKVTSAYSAVKWSKFLVEEGQEAQAVEILNQITPDKKTEFSAIPLLMKAGILAKTDKVDESLSVYDEVLSSQEWQLFHNEATIQKASLLQSQGKVEDAIELLSRVKDEENENSKFVSDSKKYIRLLKLNKNFGS